MNSFLLSQGVGDKEGETVGGLEIIGVVEIVGLGDTLGERVAEGFAVGDGLPGSSGENINSSAPETRVILKITTTMSTIATNIKPRSLLLEFSLKI